MKVFSQCAVDAQKRSFGKRVRFLSMEIISEE